MGVTVSLLPSLEPILGVSIALNLVYLNIQKFHYISIIKAKLGSRLRELDPHVIAQVENTPWYGQLKDLAGVDTIELELPNLRQRFYVKSPGTWGFVYNFFFYWRFGKIISLLATFYTLFLLFLGVGHSSSATILLVDYFNDTILSHYCLAMVAATWPILSVIAGEYVCICAARFVKYQTDNLQTQAKNDAENAVRMLNENLKNRTAH